MNISKLAFPVEKAVEGLAKSKFSKNVCTKYYNDNRKFINGLGVASIILRDGYGCYLYVKQSLNNDKIPEDKRKFVAALDLANGGLMIAMQLLMFFTISNKKVQSKMFDMFFGKIFNSRSARKGYKEILQTVDACKNMTGSQFHEGFNVRKKIAEDAFSYVTSLGAATIIGKRVIVPFIATPLADKTEKFMNRHNKQQTQPAEGQKLDITSTSDTNLLSKFKTV